MRFVGFVRSYLVQLTPQYSCLQSRLASFIYIYSEILISGSLDKWIRWLTGLKVQEPKPFFRFLTNTVK